MGRGPHTNVALVAFPIWDAGHHFSDNFWVFRRSKTAGGKDMETLVARLNLFSR